MRLAEIIELRPVPAAGLLATLTRRCPLNCAHCSTSSGPRGEDTSAGAALYEPVALLADKTGRTAAEVDASVARIDAFVRGEMARRSAAPGDDLVSRVLAAWREQGGASEGEVASLLAMLLLAGFDSTVQAMGMSVGRRWPTRRCGSA